MSSWLGTFAIILSIGYAVMIKPNISNMSGDYYFAPSTKTTYPHPSIPTYSEITGGYMDGKILCNHPNLCYIKCAYTATCKSLDINITSAANFKLLCTKIESCRGINLLHISTTNKTTIICDEEEACYQGIFNLKSSTNRIDINCLDIASCQRLKILTSHDTNELNMLCSNEESCQWGNFNLSAKTVNFQCRTYEACWANDIYGYLADTLNMICYQCWGNNLYCPSGIETKCNIHCIGSKACYGLNVYVSSDYNMGYLNITEASEWSDGAEYMELICYDDISTAKNDDTNNIKTNIRTATVSKYNRVSCECSYCCPFENKYILYNDSNSKCEYGNTYNDTIKESDISIGLIVGLSVFGFIIIICVIIVILIMQNRKKKKQILDESPVDEQQISSQTQQQQYAPQSNMMMVQLPNGNMVIAQVLSEPQQTVLNQPSAPQIDDAPEAKPWQTKVQQTNVHNNTDEMNEGELNVTGNSPLFFFGDNYNDTIE